MKTFLIEPLVVAWENDPVLMSQVQTWSWFRAAFGQVLSHQASPPQGWIVNDSRLAAVFLSWAELVELHARYERIDAADFRQFVLGQLLQKLMQSDPAVITNVPISTVAFPVMSFVLTLLKALRGTENKDSFRLDENALYGMRWASFIENVAEDASTATCFLDQMMGLKPMWNCSSLIEHRPAMEKALAERPTA